MRWGVVPNRWHLLMGLTALLVVVFARPYAGGWNDGSRLATIEALVDYRTMAIDDSIFVRVPAEHSPYTPGDALLAQYGTSDKMLIDGHFYSDKSPVPAVVMASVYQVYRWLGGPSAADRPDWFARVLTWCFAGLPLVLTVWFLGRSMRHLAVPEPWAWLLTASLVLGSMALAYTQHVNNHILLLGVVAVVAETLVRNGPLSWKGLAWLGLVAGFGYTIDLGTGPPLLVCILAWVLFTQHGHRWRATIIVGVAALPLVLAHHALNYAVAGTLSPANAHPEFFQWPGSPFNASNMTGGWVHSSVWAGLVYALDMLFGKKGFLLHTPALLAGLWAWPRLRRLGSAGQSALYALGCWSVLTWLLYAATSRNHSGLCLSIRWFVPLLVPGYLLLAVAVRELPTWRREIFVAVAGGAFLSIGMTWRGPWAGRMPPLYWPVAGATVATWAILAWQRFVAEWANRPASQPVPRLIAVMPPWLRRRLRLGT